MASGAGTSRRRRHRSTWQADRLTGSDALAVRASKKLRSDELLIGEPRLDDPAQASRRGPAVARR